jgi:hypothetical protein
VSRDHPNTPHPATKRPREPDRVAPAAFSNPDFAVNDHIGLRPLSPTATFFRPPSCGLFSPQICLSAIRFLALHVQADSTFVTFQRTTNQEYVPFSHISRFKRRDFVTEPPRKLWTPARQGTHMKRVGVCVMMLVIGATIAGAQSSGSFSADIVSTSCAIDSTVP